MNTQHTPGPWGLHRELFAVISSRTGDRNICQIIPHGTNGMDDEDIWNHRLISAAPDMLEALEMILPLAEAYLKSAPGHLDNAKLETARAAIAKTKGEGTLL